MQDATIRLQPRNEIDTNPIYAPTTFNRSPADIPRGGNDQIAFQQLLQPGKGSALSGADWAADGAAQAARAAAARQIYMPTPMPTSSGGSNLDVWKILKMIQGG